MAYVYQVSFDIPPDRQDEIEVGASLERVLGFLRVILPSEPGSRRDSRGRPEAAAPGAFVIWVAPEKGS